MELVNTDGGTFSFVDADEPVLDRLAFCCATLFAFSALSAAF